LGAEKPSEGSEKAVVLSERKTETEASVKNMKCIWKRERQRKKNVFLSDYLECFLVSRRRS